MPGFGAVQHEGGWPARHVGSEYRRRRPQPDRPPCWPMAGYVTFPNPHCFGADKEVVDCGPVPTLKPIEVQGQVYDLAEPTEVGELPTGLKQFVRFRHGREQHLIRQSVAVVSRDPHTIRTRDLPPVYSAELSEFSESLWDLPSRACERRPSILGVEQVPPHTLHLRWLPKLGERVHSAEPDRLRTAPDRKRRDRGGRLGSRERLRFWINDGHASPTESSEEQIADQLPVVHIKPFGSCDESSVVARLGAGSDGKEEVDVQTGE